MTVTDVQPAGLTFTGATGTGWTCGGTTTITCTRANALRPEASYPSDHAQRDPDSRRLRNQHCDRLGGGEANTGNDSGSDPTTVVAAVDLTINKSHSGQLHPGRRTAPTRSGVEQRGHRH